MQYHQRTLNGSLELIYPYGMMMTTDLIRAKPIIEALATHWTLNKRTTSLHQTVVPFVVKYKSFLDRFLDNQYRKIPYCGKFWRDFGSWASLICYTEILCKQFGDWKYGWIGGLLSNPPICKNIFQTKISSHTRHYSTYRSWPDKLIRSAQTL